MYESFAVIKKIRNFFKQCCISLASLVNLDPSNNHELDCEQSGCVCNLLTNESGVRAK